MSNKYKVITYSTVFSIGTILGLLFQVFQSDGGLSEFMKVPARQPQSIKKGFDYSDLSGSILQMAERDRLINSIDVERHNHELDIVMGNFVLRGQNEDKVFACGFYDTTKFEFEADGVMVEGERPSLTIESPCTVGQNVNLLEPVHIPLAEIVKGKPTDSEIKFTHNGQSVKVTVKYCPPQWPDNWVLKRVTMQNSHDVARKLEVPSFEVGMGHRNQIVMRW